MFDTKYHHHILINSFQSVELSQSPQPPSTQECSEGSFLFKCTLNFWAMASALKGQRLNGIPPTHHLNLRILVSFTSSLNKPFRYHIQDSTWEAASLLQGVTMTYVDMAVV